MRRTGILAGLAIAAAAAVPLSGAPAAAARQSQPGPLSDEAVRARADALIAQMTPEEKAGQLTQYFYFAVPGMPAAMTQPIDTAVEQGKAGSLLMVSDPAYANR